MNSSPLNLGHGGILGELSKQALDFPRAYKVLTDMLSLHSMNDAHVGYGALQGPALWFQLDVSDDDRTALLTLAMDDSALLYLILRARSWQFWASDAEMMEAVRAPVFPWGKLLRYTRKFIHGFGGTSLTRKVGVLDGKHSRQHCNRSSAPRS